MLTKKIGLAAALVLYAGAAMAGGWTLNADQSKVSFGSIKNGYTGESHYFAGMTGSVDDTGAAKIALDVTSVDTRIEIRDERMLTHVLKAVDFPAAEVTSQIDMAEMSKLSPGESTILDAELVLSFLGADIEIYTELFVLAVAEDRVLVTSDEMIMIGTDELGIEEGVEKLREIAGLDTIAQTTPVTLRLMFVKD
ncbi:MAG: YceI family protein [Pseudomonadota bacterium]